jgi:hypothetical protein
MIASAMARLCQDREKGCWWYENKGKRNCHTTYTTKFSEFEAIIDAACRGLSVEAT